MVSVQATAMPPANRHRFQDRVEVWRLEALGHDLRCVFDRRPVIQPVEARSWWRIALERTSLHTAHYTSVISEHSCRHAVMLRRPGEIYANLRDPFVKPF